MDGAQRDPKRFKPDGMLVVVYQRAGDLHVLTPATVSPIADEACACARLPLELSQGNTPLDASTPPPPPNGGA